MLDTKLPSDTVLNETPAHGLKFMGAMSTNAYIRAVLDRRGYSDAHHERGWTLVLRASGYRGPPATTARSAPEAAAAIVTLDAWDEPNFRVAGAALATEFPDQYTFLFQDLEPQTGPGAVVSITTFLDRLDTLQNGKDRKATRKADEAALAKLSDRGITAEERTRLRGLLTVALGSPNADSAPPSIKADPKAEAEQRAAKIELWTFYAEWSEIARADIKRRDYLIQLGMAKRKVRAKSG